MPSDRKDRFVNANLYLIDGLSLNIIDEFVRLLLRDRHFSLEERRTMSRGISSQLDAVTPMSEWIKAADQVAKYREGRSDVRRTKSSE